MNGDAEDAGAADFAQGIVEIVGPDLDALLSFYLALGFRLLRRTGDFAVVDWHGQRLFLAGNPQAPTVERWSSVRIMVDDLDPVLAAARAAGIEPTTPPGHRDYGLRDAVLTDPAGFGVRFAEPSR